MDKDTTYVPATHRSRLEWLDAMRGFTMLLVVAYHVAQTSFQMPLKQSASMPFLVLLRMPLFFFVSGFLAYSRQAVWGGGQWFRAVLKKSRVQLLPPVVFMLLFALLMSKHPWEAWLRMLQLPTKGGYWFTWTLLLMFVFYFSVEAVVWWTKRLPFLRQSSDLAVRPPFLPLFVCWLLSLVWYETAYLPAHFHYLKEDFWHWSSLVQVALYLHFFLFGNLVRRRWTDVQRLFDSRWFFPLVLVVAIVCCGDALKWHTLRLAWSNLPRTLAMYALLLLLVMTFRYYALFFSRVTWVGRSLQYVGRRTLDIYLLHFFLLPALPEMGKWLNATRPGFVVEQALTLGVAAVVVMACCLLSHLLRVSPLLRYYLFGRK